MELATGILFALLYRAGAAGISRAKPVASKLAAACNTCHEATGFGFIKMRDATLSLIETSPFSDESFSVR